MLTEDEYKKILDTEFLPLKKSDYSKIIQENHYFDTEDKKLKKQGSALRIRILNTKNELTFKTPRNNFLMETNSLISNQEVNKILNQGSFELDSLIEKELELNLEGIDRHSVFIHFNSFKTIRYEKKSKNNLLVLDQTFFENNSVDYELEVEGNDPVEAKIFFDSLLKKYFISPRENIAKIARAEKRK